MPSLYVHIPFCERKCVYCDFYSVESTGQMGMFLGALEREIALRRPSGAGATFDTVYLGGGTPSLLAPRDLERVMSALHDAFRVAPGAEITMEANPGTVSAESLHAYRALGVNRLSIGVQSFDPDELRFLGRIHDGAEAERAVRLARAAGFANVSVDLIYALPGQRLASWDATLGRALALGPDHVSAYSLIVEDRTPLARMVAARLVAPAPEEDEAALYEHTMAVMAAGGYEQYEVSSYARGSLRCRHNMAYWSHEPYLGFGPSAHSFWGGASGAPERSANVASVRAYAAALASGELPVVMRDVLGERELANERIFLGLRSDGLDLALLAGASGPHVRALAAALLEEGAARMSEGRLRLTARGYLLCDEIAARMMD